MEIDARFSKKVFYASNWSEFKNDRFELNNLFKGLHFGWPVTNKLVPLFDIQNIYQKLWVVIVTLFNHDIHAISKAEFTFVKFWLILKKKRTKLAAMPVKNLLKMSIFMVYGYNRSSCYHNFCSIGKVYMRFYLKYYNSTKF